MEITPEDLRPPISASTRKEALSAPLSVPIGSMGIRANSGYATNDDILKLQGIRGRREFRAMSRDCHIVAGILFAINSIFRNLTWEVADSNPSSTQTPKTKADDSDLRFMEEVLFNDMDGISFTNFVSDVLSSLVYGWSWHEIVYKRRQPPNSLFRDGLIGVRTLSLRPQLSIQRWDISALGEVRGVYQYATRGYVTGQLYIPIERSLYIISQRDQNNVEGRSLLRGAWKNWDYVRSLYEIESIGIERNLTGLPIIRIPKEIIQAAAAGDVNAKTTVDGFTKLIESVRRNSSSGVIMPSTPYHTAEGAPTGIREYDFELISSPGQTNDSFATHALERHLFSIAQSMLADFISIGQNSHGSYALVKDKRSFFELAVSGWGKLITDTINDVLIPRVWKLNGKDLQKRPYLRHGRLREEDVERLAAVMGELSRSGLQLFPDENLDKHVRGLMNLPPADEKSGEGKVRKDSENIERLGNLLSKFKNEGSQKIRGAADTKTDDKNAPDGDDTDSEKEKKVPPKKDSGDKPNPFSKKPNPFTKR